MGPHEILQAVVLPGCLAAAILLAAHRPWRSGIPPSRWSGPLAALAPGAALILAAMLLRGWPGLLPVDAVNRLPLVAAAFGAATAVIVARPRHGPRGRDPSLSAGVLTTLAWLLMGSALLLALVRPLFGGRVAALWHPGLLVSLGVLLWALAIERLLARRSGSGTPLALWLTASAVSLLLVFGASSAYLGLLGASVAAAMGPLVLIAWWRPRTTAAGAAGVASALLAILLFVGHRTSAGAGPAPWAIALVTAAPFALLLRDRPPLRRLRPWQRTLACLAVAAAIDAPAVVSAYLAYQSSNALYR